MKNLAIIWILAAAFAITSCVQPENEDLWTASYEYRLEDIMGNEVPIFPDNDADIVSSSGFSLAKKDQRLSVAHAPGCSTSNLGGPNQEFRFHNLGEFDFEDVEGSFTNAMFETLWENGKTYLLGKNGGTIYSSSILYIRIKSAEGGIKEYVTEINSSDETNRLEILSMDLVGEDELGHDVYEVKISCQSRMVNKEDATDVVYLKDGRATLKVVNFAGI